MSEAAREIQKLLTQLSTSYDEGSETFSTAKSKTKNTTASDNPHILDAEVIKSAEIATEAARRIEENPSLKSRVIEALKAGERESFASLVDNPYINILLAVAEGWLKNTDADDTTSVSGRINEELS